MRGQQVLQQQLLALLLLALQLLALQLLALQLLALQLLALLLLALLLLALLSASLQPQLAAQTQCRPSAALAWLLREAAGERRAWWRRRRTGTCSLQSSAQQWKMQLWVKLALQERLLLSLGAELHWGRRPELLL